MKITRNQLRRIIKEEMDLAEAHHWGTPGPRRVLAPGENPWPLMMMYSPEFSAKKLHGAISGLGTNEFEIAKIFYMAGRQPDNAKYLRDVADAYEAKFDSDLGEDLKNDLSESDLQVHVQAPWHGGAPKFHPLGSTTTRTTKRHSSDPLEILGI